MTTTCDRQSEVLAAFDADQLSELPALQAHADHCTTCDRAIVVRLRDGLLASGRIGRARPPGRPSLEDEAALLAGGFGPAIDVEPWLDPLPVDALPVDPLPVDALPVEPLPNDTTTPASDPVRLAEVHRLTPPGPPSPHRRPWAPWAIALGAAAAVMLLAVALGGLERGGETRIALTEASPELLARGATVGMELGIGERRCSGVRDPAGWAYRLGAAAPCPWKASAETFTMNVRVEPAADTRYVAVFAREHGGETTLLYPGPDAEAAPLDTTRGRLSDGCVEDLCWLEGGRYDVAPGHLAVVAVFSKTPLPVTEMAAQWAPWRWAGADRLVERFELEVVP